MVPQIMQAQQMSIISDFVLFGIEGIGLTETRSSKSRNDEITGELEWQVPNEKNRDSGSELLVGHVEIFHDTLQLGRSQILSVDVVEDVQHTHDWPWKVSHQLDYVWMPPT